MRIEILVDGEEPRIYLLDRPKIVVGSHESCDIVIKHKSISRKHLVLTARDDKFFVADQGSTNGSYINEQRLIPGSSTEFTSFFPVRLGDNALMTLLSDEEAGDLGPDSAFNTQADAAEPVKDESTKMISLKDLNKSSTAGLVKKRTETVTKRKTAQKAAPKKVQKQNSNMMTGVIGALLIGGAAYYQFVINKKEDKVAVATEAAKVAPAVVDNSPILRIDENDLFPPEKILEIYKNPKCTMDVEKYVCGALPLIFQGQWGTVLMEKTIIIIADGAKYATDAKAYVKATEADYKMDLGLMALMLWMKDNVPTDVKSIKGLENHNIAVALVDTTKPEEPTIVNAAVFVPASLLRLRQVIQPQDFADAQKNGATEFSYALEYLRFL